MIRKSLFFCSVSLALLLSGSAQAQQEQYRWRVGAYLGSMGYYGDLNHQLIPDAGNTSQPAFGFSLERILDKAWSAKLLYTQGQWMANDRANDALLSRSLNAKTEVQDYSLLFTYYLDNNRQLGRRSFLAPYVSFGLGYTDFSVYGDLRDGNGDYYHYWSDYSIHSTDETDANAAEAEVVGQDGVYETELSSLSTEKEYPTESFSLPVALGLKFRLSSNINLNLELLMRYAFTDYLDDVSGGYRADYSSPEQSIAANPTGQAAAQRGSSPNVNDFYAFPSVSLHYSFARRKRAYRAPKLYAVADRVDRFTPTPQGPLTVIDTIAALTIDPTMGENEVFPFADSLRIVPLVVGQDTLLAIVQSVVDSTATLPEGDSSSLATTPPVFQDTLAIVDMAMLSSDSLATDSTGLSLIPLSLDRAIQARATDSGTELRLVETKKAPAAKAPSSLGSFNPLPDSTATRPVPEPAISSAEAPTPGEPVPFSTLPPPQKGANEPTKSATSARPASDMPKAKATPTAKQTTAPPASKTSEKKPPLKPTASAASTKPKTDSSSVKASPETKTSVAPPAGGGIAIVPTVTSGENEATTQLDSSYVTALTARMDTFSGYLDEVSQKNDTSFTSILSELEQLKAQLNNLDNAPQPAAQVASIEQRLRTLKLQELENTEVYFGVGSSAVSPVGAERLQQVGVLVKNAPEATVRLRGFTDTTGNPERNQLLSQKRAEAVRAILVETGVPDDRISAAFFGADRTLSKDQASYGRRVEVVVEE